MGKKVLLVILVFLSVSSIFGEEPKWYPSEKYHQPLHIGVSSGMVIGAYYGYRYLHQLTLHERIDRLNTPVIQKRKKLKYLFWATFTSLSAGLIKEIVDAAKNDEFNLQDMRYNLDGIQIGIIFVCIVDL